MTSIPIRGRVYVLYRRDRRGLRLDAFHTRERGVEEFLVEMGIKAEVNVMDFDPDDFAKAAGFREQVVGEVWSWGKDGDDQHIILAGIDTKG